MGVGGEGNGRWGVYWWKIRSIMIVIGGGGGVGFYGDGKYVGGVERLRMGG